MCIRDSGGIQAGEAAEDALRRGAIELLVRDGARQRMKRRVLGIQLVRETAGGADEIRKNRVDFREPAPEGGELGRSAQGRRCVHAAILVIRCRPFTSGSGSTSRWSVVPA